MSNYTKVFEKVWYRSRHLGLTEPAVRAMEAVGTLYVDIGKLVFVSNGQRVEVRDVVSVSRSRHGRDFINAWITVEYGQGGVALFVDGRLLGWRGILGGNRRLYAEITKAFAQT